MTDRLSPSSRLRLSRLVVFAVFNSLPERPRGGEQGLRRGPADEGAAEGGAPGPRCQAGLRQQPQPQRPFGQGEALLSSSVVFLSLH